MRNRIKKNKKKKKIRISSGHNNDNIDNNKKYNYHYFKNELERGNNKINSFSNPLSNIQHKNSIFLKV